jgi:hypothetical protein
VVSTFSKRDLSKNPFGNSSPLPTMLVSYQVYQSIPLFIVVSIKICPAPYVVASVKNVAFKACPEEIKNSFE